jgi:predicted nucleic-acid-binding protein
MIGIDTNVLVRYIVQDHPAQASAATRFIEKRCTAAEPGWIADLVLCELVWVLERGYGYKRHEIAEVLKKVLASIELRVQSSDMVWRAVRRYEEGGAGFADCFLGLANREHKACPTHTFDRKAAAHADLFQLIKS